MILISQENKIEELGAALLRKASHNTNVYAGDGKHLNLEYLSLIKEQQHLHY